MATSDIVGAAARHVRCPKCHSILQEPAGVPVYQCGGCGATLRASPRAASSPRQPPADARAADAASPQSVLPPSPQRSQRSGDVASTSARDAPTENAGDVAPEVRRPESPVVEEKGHDRRSADREAGASSESPRGTGGDASFSGGSRDAAAETRESETRREEADAASRKKGSGETAPAPARPRSRNLEEAASMPAGSSGSPRASPSARPRSRNLEEAPSMSAPAADDVRPGLKSRRGDDAAEGKALPSPPRHALSPLHEKILKTVDELKGDLSELFSQPPEVVVKPRTPSRPPRHLLPRQQQERGHVPRPAAIPATRARPAAAGPRGLPSRRYRRCRPDPCGHDARPGSPCHGHHGCCRDRHCCGGPASSRAQRREEKTAARAEEVSKRRAAPPTRLQRHCRPVLKGAPFIVCSSCFALVQVPAGFVVPASSKVRELRCGACSAVLSYSYRDRDRETKKNPPPPENGHGARRPDLFAFIDDFAAPSSYSTTEDDEPQPLHVSRNSSFDEKPRKQSNSLHRLMGYGSARELLLLPRSPSLYEHGSFDGDDEEKRTPTMTPPRGASRRYEHGDRKGKGVCLDADTDDGEDDSDDTGALRRSWRLHGRGGMGDPPPPGAIRIRS